MKASKQADKQAINQPTIQLSNKRNKGLTGRPTNQGNKEPSKQASNQPTTYRPNLY
jgi:hypothetical protein